MLERRQRWTGGFKTFREAERERDRLVAKKGAGNDPFPEHITLRAFAKRWLEHQSTRVRFRTAERYQALLRDDVLPEIGDLRLDRIRPAHVQQVLDKMRERGLSPRTIIQARSVLGAALRQAVAWGLITNNPVQAVRPPQAERPRLEIPSPEQLAALIEVAKGTPWEIPILLAAVTGARRSEVLAIRWADVDSKGRVRIVRGLQRLAPGADQTLGFLDPKTPRGRRVVELPAIAHERIRRHRQEQTSRRLALKREWIDLDLVCDRGDGAALSPDSFSHSFKRLAHQAGLHPSTRLHDVRHAVATELGRRGVHPVVVAAVLGHSTPAFTMATYQHAWDEGSEQAATAMGDALGGHKGPAG